MKIESALITAVPEAEPLVKEGGVADREYIEAMGSSRNV
jgi:ornithine cyclodeaminase/alanine dehydrogenase-like protein (mu-crystallin family)